MTDTNLQPKIGLAHILESAVILSWGDLMKGASGNVHIECSNGPDRALEFLKIWSSTLRGDWSLVCEYWMRPRPALPAGVTFSNGYCSSQLTRMLGMIMQHQQSFVSDSAPLAADLIQVGAPSRKDVTAAEKCMRDAENDPRCAVDSRPISA
jgi:hypothetical protein